MIISTAGVAQEKNVKAFYLGYDQEFQTYLFEDADGVNIEFNNVKNEVLKQFDLTSPKFVDQAFLITYLTKEIENEEEYYHENTIIFLKPTVLERNEVLEEEY